MCTFQRFDSLTVFIQAQSARVGCVDALLSGACLSPTMVSSSGKEDLQGSTAYVKATCKVNIVSKSCKLTKSRASVHHCVRLPLLPRAVVAGFDAGAVIREWYREPTTALPFLSPGYTATAHARACTTLSGQYTKPRWLASLILVFAFWHSCRCRQPSDVGPSPSPTHRRRRRRRRRRCPLLRSPKPNGTRSLVDSRRSKPNGSVGRWLPNSFGCLLRHLTFECLNTSSDVKSIFHANNQAVLTRLCLDGLFPVGRWKV